VGSFRGFAEERLAAPRSAETGRPRPAGSARSSPSHGAPHPSGSPKRSTRQTVPSPPAGSFRHRPLQVQRQWLAHSRAPKCASGPVNQAKAQLQIPRNRKGRALSRGLAGCCSEWLVEKNARLFQGGGTTAPSADPGRRRGRAVVLNSRQGGGGRLLLRRTQGGGGAQRSGSGGPRRARPESHSARP
jgi:hypothetical protein